MAETKIIIEKAEFEEKDEIVQLIQSLKKQEKAKLKGFLEGLYFARDFS